MSYPTDTKLNQKLRPAAGLDYDRNPPSTPMRGRIMFRLVFGTAICALILFCITSGVRSFQHRSYRAPSSDLSTVRHKKHHKPHDIIQLQSLHKDYVPRKPNGGERARRLVVVGDVHGCYDELVDLLGEVDFSTKYDHLILVGDLIAKGPHSDKVIALARSHNASCVRGNHEHRMLVAYAELERSRAVGKQQRQQQQEIVAGPAEARHDAEELARTLSEADIEWLASCPLILNIGDIPGLGYANNVVVHAGLVPGTELERQTPNDVMNMRTMDSETLVPSSGHDGTPWWEVWGKAQKKKPKGERTLIMYGHDARTGLKENKYSVGLDSGCVYGRKLSALVIQGGKAEAKMHVKSIDCRRAYQKG